MILFLYQIYFNQILTLFLIKMKELTILLFCIIAMFVYMNYIRKSLHLSLIESSIDNQKYLVRNLKDNKEAANKLAQLSQSLSSLVDSVKSNKKKDGVNRLVDNFDPLNITENIPGSMYVAYSVNKGEELSICLREKDTEKFMDQNNENESLFIKINNERYKFDLRGFVNKEIFDLNVKNIENIDMDTYAQEDFFYSYRRSKNNKEKDYGRCISVILMT